MNQEQLNIFCRNFEMTALLPHFFAVLLFSRSRTWGIDGSIGAHKPYNPLQVWKTIIDNFRWVRTGDSAPLKTFAQQAHMLLGTKMFCELKTVCLELNTHKFFLKNWSDPIIQNSPSQELIYTFWKHITLKLKLMLFQKREM